MDKHQIEQDIRLLQIRGKIWRTGKDNYVVTIPKALVKTGLFRVGDNVRLNFTVAVDNLAAQAPAVPAAQKRKKTAVADRTLNNLLTTLYKGPGCSVGA